MGVVLKLDQSRREERDRQWREVALANASEHWLGDLETWPNVFHRTLRGRVERDLGLDHSELRDENFGPLVWERCRANPDAREAHHPGSLSLWPGFFDRVRANVRQIGSSWGPSHRKRAREELLWTLWLYGRPRIERAEFEPGARELLAQELREIAAKIDRAEQRCVEIGERLRIGISTSGKRKGQPYSTGRRLGLESELNAIERDRRALEARRAAILAEPDPLRAWGLLSPRRHAARSEPQGAA